MQRYTGSQRQGGGTLPYSKPMQQPPPVPPPNPPTNGDSYRPEYGQPGGGASRYGGESASLPRGSTPPQRYGLEAPPSAAGGYSATLEPDTKAPKDKKQRHSFFGGVFGGSKSKKEKDKDKP